MRGTEFRDEKAKSQEIQKVQETDAADVHIVGHQDDVGGRGSVRLGPSAGGTRGG